MSLMTAPTRAPAACTLPPRIFSATSEWAEIAGVSREAIDGSVTGWLRTYTPIFRPLRVPARFNLFADLCAVLRAEGDELRVTPGRVCVPGMCWDFEVCGDASKTSPWARLLGSPPPLNLWVRTAPRGAEHFCWRIDILPRLTHLAGLELGAGVHLNVVPPERAAAELREA